MSNPFSARNSQSARAFLEYPDLKRTVLENYDRWNQIAPSCVLVIEKKGSGLSLIQDLRRDDIHVIGITPDGDKIMRMAAQTAVIEAGYDTFRRKRTGLRNSRRSY